MCLEWVINAHVCTCLQVCTHQAVILMCLTLRSIHASNLVLCSLQKQMLIICMHQQTYVTERWIRSVCVWGGGGSKKSNEMMADCSYCCRISSCFSLQLFNTSNVVHIHIIIGKATSRASLQNKT